MRCLNIVARWKTVIFGACCLQPVNAASTQLCSIPDLAHAVAAYRSFIIFTDNYAAKPTELLNYLADKEKSPNLYYLRT